MDLTLHDIVRVVLRNLNLAWNDEIFPDDATTCAGTELNPEEETLSDIIEWAITKIVDDVVLKWKDSERGVDPEDEPVLESDLHHQFLSQRLKNQEIWCPASPTVPSDVASDVVSSASFLNVATAPKTLKDL